jgi:hypothetical protein
LPDTAHTAALRTHPAEYRERVLEHFDEVLLGSG